MSEFAVTERGGAVRFAVRVQPRASRTEVDGTHGDALKVRVNAPPVDGAANEAVVAMLAERLGIPRGSVRVLSGHRSRRKIIEIEGLGAESIRALV